MDRLWIASAVALAFLAAVASTTARGEGGYPPATDREARIERLVEQLGDPDYHRREAAQAKLLEFGVEAFEALSAAEMHPDLEVARRAGYLVHLIRVAWVADDDPPAVRRVMEGYDAEDRIGRITRIGRLASLPHGEGIVALCRLVRFETSPYLSRLAAAEALQLLATDTAGLSPQVSRTLGASTRPGAEWLRTFLAFSDDPPATLEAWEQIIDQERTLLVRAPTQTSLGVLHVLLRQQFAWLRELERRDEALAVVQALIDLEEGDPDRLLDLTEWLIDQQEWEALAAVVQRFGEQFRRDPFLTYALADAYQRQGDTDRAEALAAEALALYPESVREHAYVHLEVANALRRRGLFRWAEREYRHVADSLPPVSSEAPFSLVLLSEMLHDQGDHERAAEVVAETLERMERHNATESNAFLHDFSLTARMYYFRACHWREEGDWARHREVLEKALAADPHDVETLIALYRVPDQSEEERRRVLGLIEEAAARLRARIAQAPDDSIPYNELAWLIGNTEGDLAEAIRLSKRSLELAGESAAYYDTLARCYYARGDLDEALRFQARAVELEPHSGPIAAQMELIRRAHEAAQGAGDSAGQSGDETEPSLP